MTDFSKEKEVICIKNIKVFNFIEGKKYKVMTNLENNRCYAASSNNEDSGVYLDDERHNHHFKKVEYFEIKQESDYYKWLANR